MSKQKERKRENQGEGCRRHLRQFLASLLLRLMSSPSTPSPAAHHFARFCQRSGRGTGGHLVRFWAMQSPPHRHTSPPIYQQPAAGQRLGGLPSCPPRPLPRHSLLSVAITVHALASSSLPSSYAVPVILRPDLVRSLSSVRPPVFLFLVPRSPSCRLTAKPSPAAHYLTRSHPRHGCKGSSRPVLVVIPSPPPRHRPATGTGGPLPASPSPYVRW